MNLSWIKCTGEVWCKLDTVNLEHVHFGDMDGVYIIWHGGTNALTVYVGQGNIRERLKQHRTNTQIQQYAHHTLYVTWASVPAIYQNGVEIYLANHLKPLVGERHPTVAPVDVNLPW